LKKAWTGTSEALAAVLEMVAALVVVAPLVVAEAASEK
jgi:hypothetical protein